MKRVRTESEVYAHGAVKPVLREGEWVYFGATVADGEEYPVVFQVKNLPELIEWLQKQVKL